MAEPWKAERSTSLSEARRRIESQFPELRPVEISPFGEGWDNVVFRVNGQWAFHFPRRQLGADILGGEIATLKMLAQSVPGAPLEIPIPTYVGTATPEGDWPFVGYQEIQGTTWCRADLTLSERLTATRPLATFLRWLHTVPISPRFQQATPIDLIGRLDLSKRVDQATEYLERTAKLGFPIDRRWIKQYLVYEAPQLRKPLQNSLVHGDLYSRHLVVDDTHQLTGVIDWGDVHRGDAASDLAIVHLVLPQAAHSEFLAIYGDVDDDTWALARFAAVRHCLITAVYGHDIGDDALIRESRFALESLFPP